MFWDAQGVFEMEQTCLSTSDDARAAAAADVDLRPAHFASGWVESKVIASAELADAPDACAVQLLVAV